MRVDVCDVEIESAQYILAFCLNSTLHVISHYIIRYRVKDNEKEVDVVVELPQGRILCEVKYRENTHIRKNDAIIELVNDPKAKVIGALMITKRIEDYGAASHNTLVPVVRIPAAAFLYLLGHAEKEGYVAAL